MRPFSPTQPPKLQRDLLNSNYRYQEYLPTKSLESFVACYWTVDFNASETNKLHRVIPDGCVDIIFNLRSPSFSKGAFVSGLMTKFEVITLSQDYSLFGIRFFLDTVQHFLRYPVSEFIGNHVFLEEIWGNEGLFLMENIISSTQISEIIEKVEFKLMKFFLLNEIKTDRLLQTSMHYMYAHQGTISLRSLSEKLHYSERHIRRTFQKELGVSPKELLNIIRFQSLLQELYIVPQSCFTDIAVKYGYYDQPHFIKNFKSLYGIVPSKIFRLNQQDESAR
jgi:AraC-like DNA-binding protein